MAYSVADYGKMFDDKWRMDAYISAMKKHIGKDSIVLDLGAGTGIFSLLACKLGAKKVFAVEPNTSINVGVQTAKKNGYSEKIQFINKNSSEVKLGERVDLIISDLRGILPLLGNNIETIIDARKRFLKRSGTLIPGTDKIYASIVNSPRLYRNIVNTWDKNRYTFDLADGKNVCLNKFYSENFKSSRLISDTKLWQIINYRKVKQTNFNKRLNLKIIKKSTAHGIAVWFDSELVTGVKLRNSPDVEGSKVYGRAFFPFLEPLKVDKGNRINIDLSASLVSGEYIWNWNTNYYKKKIKKPTRQFKQSTFFSVPLTPEYFLKRAHNYKTSINENAVVLLDVLKMFSNNKELIEIAESISKKYPNKFKTINESISFVGNLTEKYSE